MTAEIIFWASVLLIFHSYIFYPLLLDLLAQGREMNTRVYRNTDKLPFVSVIIAAYNEEKVILEKIRRTFHTLYPFSNLEVLVGSDASKDHTNRICEIYSENYENLIFFPFKYRQGKPGIINQLVNEANGEILIFTDAKVFFQESTIFELVKHFRNPQIAVVGGNIVNQEARKDGVSIQEKAFMSREIRMKYLEGLIWGKTMGVYGAVYAIRKSMFNKIPDNFTVEDFYITMKVLEKKKKAILNLQALTFENVPNEMGMEFRRKVRISSGNFQNLRVFFKLLWPPWSALSFAFFSHKVIRWTGPFLILLALVVNIYLASYSQFYKYILIFQSILMLMPLIDLILRKINLHIVLLRFITHFYAMNLALLIGFFKNLLGFKTNIWQPTRR